MSLPPLPSNFNEITLNHSREVTYSNIGPADYFGTFRVYSVVCYELLALH
jgi:hypothetical protein